MTQASRKNHDIEIPDPPHTPKKPVIDIVHGVEIADPYRWLEDGESEETRSWTQAQNERTEYVLKQLPTREFFRQRIEELLSQDTVSSPVLRGKRLFYMKRIPSKNQPLLMLVHLDKINVSQKDFTIEEKVVVDPNEESETGIVSLDWWYPSPDGTMLAYGLSTSGDEWSVLHIMNVDTGECLPETIERTRYAGVTWKKDNTGFYYGRYPKPGQVPPGEENYNQHIYYHEIGTDPEKDPKVFGEGRPREQSYSTSLSDDGRYLLLTVGHGWNSTDLYFRDETVPGSDFIPIVEGEDAIFYGQIRGDTLYMITNFQAPKYKIVKVDLKNPHMDNWVTIIDESPEMTIEGVEIAGGHIAVSKLKDAISHLYTYTMDGQLVREVPLPTMGTITGLAGDLDEPLLFFTFESFLIPPAIYMYDLEKQDDPIPFIESAKVVDENLASIEQVFYRSKDGTIVPMFILKRKDCVIGDKPYPTVLTGYGGFNISRTPTYSPSVIPWIEAGGIYASANLRGGSEYGEEWHRAGMLDKKQNVFDDFVAAAEYLIGKGYTDQEHLGIWGRSNGGLLVGAALTQRPDLFKAVACGVPLLDMVRYHKFLIASLWCYEYGNPDNPEDFQWIYAYSPYHHVQEGVSYPAVYFYTAESDTRVDPMHAKKMTALMQDVASRTPAKGPILLNVESEAGHGVGKPVYKIVEEQANMWAFLAWQLGLEIG